MLKSEDRHRCGSYLCESARTDPIDVKIGAGATLEVIPVETAYGCLVLGAVVPEALAQVSAPPE